MDKILNDFNRYGYFLIKLISRDFQKKYYRSVLGVLWTILHPLLMMCIITIVFSTLFRRNIENYPIYYFTGNLIFSMCRECTTQSLYAITGNAGLIKKISIPKYFFAISKVALSVINLLFSLIPLAILMVIMKAKISWTLLLFPVPLLLLVVFSVGMSIAISAMSVYFSDLTHLYSLFTLAWMYLTPIFYPYEIIPDRWRFLFQLNPMFYYVDMFRSLVYKGVLPSSETVIFACVCSALMLIAGSYIYYKLKNNFFLYL